MQTRLPLFGRVLFVDWHGVLSTDLYWASVMSGRSRVVRSAVEGRLQEIFSCGQALSDNWMLGQVSTQDLFESVVPMLGSSRRADFLQRRIVDDCLRMKVDTELASVLGTVSGHLPVVIATDNTNDFVEAFWRARRAKRRRDLTTPSEPTLTDTASFFDDIICSSEVGTFKATDPRKFFGDWLALNGLSFRDALLIDDRADNCGAFVRVGGTSIQWPKSSAGKALALAEIVEWAAGSRVSYATHQQNVGC